jgi:hypothetical protein
MKQQSVQTASSYNLRIKPIIAQSTGNHCVDSGVRISGIHTEFSNRMFAIEIVNRHKHVGESREMSPPTPAVFSQSVHAELLLSY